MDAARVDAILEPGTAAHVLQYLRRGTCPDGERCVTDRIEAAERLRRSEEHSRRVIEASPTPLAVVDNATGAIVTLNDEFTRVFGYTAEDLPTRERIWEQLFPDPSERGAIWSQWRSRIEPARSTGQLIESLEVRVQCKDGTFRNVLGHFAASHDLNIINFVDITERRAAEDQLRRYQQGLEDLVIERTSQLREANAQLAELDRVKATMTAMLVHDLRSPLTVLQFVLEEMIEVANQERHETSIELANTAASSVTKMIALVSDMLEIYRTDAVVEHFSMRAIDPLPALSQALSYARITSQHSGIDVQARISTSLPMILADDAKLDRVLTNLVSNAVKFTPRGGSVTLSAFVAGNVVRIQVSDTGCGIAADDLPKVFDPFVQAASNKRTQGIGLGLAIVKRIVERFGATIAVESEVGAGTTFTMDVPISGHGFQETVS